VTQKEIEAYAEELIDTSVKGIIEKLGLRQPIYKATSAYGHFGQEAFSWEQIATV
jgi:S-adenosylmethionine synthetase